MHGAGRCPVRSATAESDLRQGHAYPRAQVGLTCSISADHARGYLVRSVPHASQNDVAQCPRKPWYRPSPLISMAALDMRRVAAHGGMKERTMNTLIRWGIVGTGRIARRFAQGLAHVPAAQLGALWSRRPEPAAAFAQEFGGVACREFRGAARKRYRRALYRHAAGQPRRLRDRRARGGPARAVRKAGHHQCSRNSNACLPPPARHSGSSWKR